MVDSVDPKPVPTTGNDKFTGTSGNDVLSGYNGNDSLTGGAGDDLFQEGSYTWKANAGSFKKGSTYDMGVGNDTFNGGDGFDMLSVAGMARAGTLNLSAGTLTRGAEVDHFSSVELFELGEGADKVTGFKDNVYVATMGGNDTVVGLCSNSVIDGGTGLDVLDLTAETAMTQVDLSNTGTINASKTTFVIGFETVLGALDAQNFLSGGTAAESLVGGNLADTLWGGNGIDTLLGGGGNDTVHGDAGNDSIDGGLGKDSLYGDDGNDHVYGGDGDDYIVANAGRDSVYGGTGNDRLYAAVSAALYGDAGNDLVFADISTAPLYGGDGNDSMGLQQGTVHGGAGDDYATQSTQGAPALFYLDDGNDHAEIYNGTVYGGNGDDDLLSVSTDPDANATLHGGAGNDTFEFGYGVAYGDAGADVFRPAGQQATLYGGGGSDSLYGVSVGTFMADGGGGGDYLYLDSGTDTHVTLTVTGGSGNDTITVSSRGGIDISGGAGSDSIAVESQGQVDGGDGADTVLAYDVNGTIDLGTGNDQIQFLSSGLVSSHGEAVTLSTGAGQDVIQIDQQDFGRVEVTDFDVQRDVISFSGVSSLADIDSATETATGVRLVESGFVLILDGLTLADLTDAVFVPL